MNEAEVFFNEGSLDGICSIARVSNRFDIDEFMGEKYVCFYFWDIPAERATYYLIIRKSALPKKGRVKFKVANSMIGRVIGTGGRNIKRVAEALGLHITVQGVNTFEEIHNPLIYIIP